MGMPRAYLNEGDSLTIEAALGNLQLSVALEQYALAHILNAEGEQLQLLADDNYINDLCGRGNPLTIDDFISMTSEATGVVQSVQSMQCHLMKKLAITNSALGGKPGLPTGC
jgi:hypothetical protein